MLLDEFIVGAEFALESVRITREDIDAFAPRFDPLPFHTDDEAAKRSRFGGIIAPGMLSFACVWAQWLRTGLYDDCIAGLSATVNWTRPVYPGDVLTGAVAVDRVLPNREDQGILVLRVHAFNQEGEAVLNARVTAMVKR